MSRRAYTIAQLLALAIIILVCGAITHYGLALTTMLLPASASPAFAFGMAYGLLAGIRQIINHPHPPQRKEANDDHRT